MPNSWTIRQLLEWTTEYFRKAKLEEPLLCAQLLLAKVMKCNKVDLYLRFEQPVSSVQRDEFRELVKRAYQGEPIAYILGEKEFFSLPIKINRSVLIPRPETELLVQWVVRKARESYSENPRIDILDIGSGSGCISIALAKNLPVDANIIACDISQQALEIANENCKIHAVTDKITLKRSNLFESIDNSYRFDFIVSNPPYITEKDYNDLPKSIKEYEPTEALLAGTDGLDVINKLIEKSQNYLKSGGWLVFEIGYNQREQVEKKLRENRYENVDFEKDANNIPRIAIGQKSP